MSGTSADDTLVTRWRETLALHARTLNELDRALHPHGLGASDFEVLDVLAATTATDDARPPRIQELATRVHLSQSTLSRLVGRLEREGLVSRTTCTDDRRSVRVTLTAAGRRRHAAALPDQRAVLARMLPPH